jgi:hypothetical protein
MFPASTWTICSAWKRSFGYLTDPTVPGNSFHFVARDSSGAVVEGNSNAGHDYGNAGLTDDQRRALVEHMKML